MPRSSRRALGIIILGFGTEGVTEVYQFFSVGHTILGWVGLYYLSLGTTVLGFVFIFLGAREWRAFRPKATPPPGSKIPWGAIGLFSNACFRIVRWLHLHTRPFQRRRPMLGPTLLIASGTVTVIAAAADHSDSPTPGLYPLRWPILVLLLGGTAATALLNGLEGTSGPNDPPFWVVWTVGGLVVLGFGNFFLGLRNLVRRFETRFGNVLGWSAFAWSLGVSVITGNLVGNQIVVFLHEFFTNWVALIVTFAPVANSMAPLFVTYFLLAGAYAAARRQFEPRGPGFRPPDDSVA